MNGLGGLSEQLQVWGGAIGLAGLVLAAHRWLQRSTLRRERAAHERLAQLEESDSLVDARREREGRQGSDLCVRAPPEHDALQILGGVARLASPPGCLDRGRCEGGPFVVGALTGSGLLGDAVRQGAQAGSLVARSKRVALDDALDAVVVGASPAGISAARSLRQAEKRFVLLDCEVHGGTTLRYPCGKVMRAGELDLPGYGRIRRRRMSMEETVTRWLDDPDQTGLPLHTETRLIALALERDGTWRVEGEHATLRATHVILALGRRPPPRAGSSLP